MYNTSPARSCVSASAVLPVRRSNAIVCFGHLKPQLAKLKREQYGASAERIRCLFDQMELLLEELEADASEDALVAEAGAKKTASVRSLERKPPMRKPFPEHLPRERVVVPSPFSSFTRSNDSTVPHEQSAKSNRA